MSSRGRAMTDARQTFAKALAMLLVLFCVLTNGTAWAQNSTERPSWDGANYSSLADFISALEAERYTGLVFKRMSGDLARGRAAAMHGLLERYFQGRRERDGRVHVETYDLVSDVEEDVRSALKSGSTSEQLEVPDYMIEPVVALARRIALEVYGLREDRPVDTLPVQIPDTAVVEDKPVRKARAENTGLYRDAADMVRQEHLQFLVGGDALSARVRVLSEVLKIARSDKFVVDVASVVAFTDRLVEAEVVHEDERQAFTARVLDELGMTLEEPRDVVKAQPDEEPAKEVVPEAPEPEDREPLPAPEPADPLEDTGSNEAQPEPDTADEDVRYLPDVDAWPGPPAASQTTVTPAPPVRYKKTPAPQVRHKKEPSEVRSADPKSDRLLVVETGMGASLPTQKGDLEKVNQRIGFDPGIAARFGASFMWLNAIGDAHVSVGLFGVLGENQPDSLTGPGGPVTSGARTYYGVLPFIAVELPAADRINMRLGGGIGVAHQRLDVFSGGAKVISANGTSLLAQIGGGVRFELAPCIDTGIDVFATYLDGVLGTGVGGAALRLDGTWDVAAYASVRFVLSGADQNGTCGMFGP